MDESWRISRDAAVRQRDDLQARFDAAEAVAASQDERRAYWRERAERAEAVVEAVRLSDREGLLTRPIAEALAVFDGLARSGEQT